MRTISKKRLIVIFVMALLCSLCFMTACGAADKGPMASMFAVKLDEKNVVTADEVTGEAAEVSEVKVGDLRIQLLSDTVLRIEERSEEDKFENRASYLVPDRSGWEKTTFDVEEKSGETLISVKKADGNATAYVVHIPDSAAGAEDVTVTKEDGAPVLFNNWLYTAMIKPLM